MRTEQWASALGVALAPLGFFIVALITRVLIRNPIERWLPEGRLKRILLRKVN
jgi:hypothetical protein